MRTLFARAGVDYEQWKAVSKTLLRADFRPPGASTNAMSLRTVSGFLLMAIVYGLFGLVAAAITLLNDDVLLTGMIALTYLSTLVMTSVLTDHAAAMLSTTDYAILGSRPVSSRTFLAIRLTNILFHTLLLTTFMGYPVVIANMIADGFNPARGLAAGAALYAIAIATTLALVASYAFLLRTVGAARVRRVFSYAQMAFGAASYGGFVVLMDEAGRSVVANIALARGAWVYFAPPAWYASYIELAQGDALGDAGLWARAGLSLVFIGALLVLMRDRLGMDYAEKLGALTADASIETAPRPERRAWVFTHDEARAVALLVRSHFRHDLKVRLGILAIVPMTLIYLYMGMQNDVGGDPFVSGERRGGIDFLAMAVLFFPSILTLQLVASEAHQGSWIYFATPSDQPGVIIALKNVITAFFIVPFIAFLGVVFLWRFGHVGHALVHAAMLGLVAHLVLQSAILADPRLPFSMEPKRHSSSAGMFAWMMGVMIGGNLFLSLLQFWVYRSWLRIGVVAVVLLLATWLINRPIRARAQRQLGDLASG